MKAQVINAAAAALVLSKQIVPSSAATARSLLRGAKPDAQKQRELDADNRIINGSEAAEDRYSYAVSLQDGIGHFCGGSLIARDVVLTAAHCQGGSYDVVLGRHDLDDGDGEVIGMRDELPHPNYNPSMTDNDFMLVFLDSPVSNAGSVDFVSLNSQSSVPSLNEEVTVMGWGVTNTATGSLSDVLMHVDVNVISNSECDDSSDGRDNYNGQITSNMLCARRNSRDSCQGDSGGPLIIRGANAGADVQVGVVSWGIDCAHPDFPGVYARVSRAYDWIEREVCRGSSHASDAGFDCGNVSASPSSGGGGGGSTGGGSSTSATYDDYYHHDSSSSSGGTFDDYYYFDSSPSSGSGGSSSGSGSSGGSSGGSEMDEDYFYNLLTGGKRA